MLRRVLYDKMKADIENDFEIRRRALELERERALKAFDKFWADAGGEEPPPHDTLGEAASEKLWEAFNGASNVVQEDWGSHRRNFLARYNAALASKPSIKAEVLEILAEMRDRTITQTEVRERYMERYPDVEAAKIRPSISHALRNLKDAGVLNLVEEGVAGAPHKYRVKNENQGELLGS